MFSKGVLTTGCDQNRQWPNYKYPAWKKVKLMFPGVPVKKGIK